MGSCAFLDKFDLVAIGVLDEGDDRAAKFHGACFPDNLAAAMARYVTGLGGILHFDGDMSESIAKLIVGCFPVMGQFKDGGVRLILVTKEGEGEFTIGVVLAAKQSHPQDVLVEVEGPVKIADPKHGVQNSHGVSLDRSNGYRRNRREDWSLPCRIILGDFAGPILLRGPGVNDAVHRSFPQKIPDLLGIPKRSVGPQFNPVPGGKIKMDHRYSRLHLFRGLQSLF